MAQARATWTSRLLTPQVARQDGVPQGLQDELNLIYQALRNLAQILDISTGRQIYPPGETPDPADDWRNTFLIERFSYMYLPFTMDAEYGKLVAINPSGQAVFPTMFGGLPDNATNYHPIGYVAEENVVAGTFGKVATRGLIRVTGATPGDWLSWNWFDNNGGFVLAHTGSSRHPVIARVLTDKYIWFTGITRMVRN